MKYFYLILLSFLLIALQVNGQEKWNCYTDDEALLIDDNITLGVFDYKDGSTWFVTQRGVNIFKDGSWTTINKKTELLKNKIGSYLVDRKDQIWIGTGSPDIFFDGYVLGQLYQGGVMIYDGEEWKPMNTKEMGIKAPVITQMHEATNGDIWLGVSSVNPGSERGGLFAKGALLRLAKETGEWTVYRQKDMPCLDCHFVKDFYEDENGNLFFIARWGIYYFEDGKFHSVGKDNEEFSFGNGDFITAKFVDSNNNLWLGTTARITSYNGSTWRSFNRKNGLTSQNGYPYGFVETADKKIIMTAVNGLYTYNNEDQWEQEKIKYLYGNSYLDDQNRLWLPYHKGLIIRDAENETMYKDIPKVHKIFEDHHGGVWALSRNKGVKRYKDGEWKLFNEDNQLPSNSITLTYVSNDGTVWLGTNKGICSCEYD